jgi:RNA polymerase sigma-70 factor (ECF subfamily)
VTDDLALRLSADVDGCFPDVVAGYRQAVYSTALRMSDRPDDAADMAAEAFLRAYAALRAYPAERIAVLRLRPWLLTIVLNVARNEARSDRRRVRQSPLAGATEPSDAREGPEDHAARHAGQARLGDLLTGLPDSQRVAVVLRHVIGLPYCEVAEVMGCPEGTAKSHVSRGLRQLRARLTEEDRP